MNAAPKRLCWRRPRSITCPHHPQQQRPHIKAPTARPLLRTHARASLLHAVARHPRSRPADVLPPSGGGAAALLLLRQLAHHMGLQQQRVMPAQTAAAAASLVLWWLLLLCAAPQHAAAAGSHHVPALWWRRLANGWRQGAAASVAAAADPLGTCRLLAECLYQHNDLSADCIPAYCQPSVVQHGDGVWLPRTTFQGAGWVTSLHRELFSEYSGWRFRFLEVAATPGAARGFTEVIGFFHWSANNTGSYHGLAPSLRRSSSYGVLHFATDKSGRVTDVTIWRSGFQEERDVLLLQPGCDDVITPLRDITQQPFWIPSQSLQLKMLTHAHTLIEVLNQGEKFLDSLDDICVSSVVLIDGMAIWGPSKAVGLTDLKLWLAGWLQLYDVNVAVTASTATPTSNKVFLCIKMQLVTSGRATQVDGCLVYVFNIQGFITHIVLFRNGTPQEMADKFIGGRVQWQQQQQWRQQQQQEVVAVN